MRLIDADELLTAFPVDDEPMLTKSCVRMTIQHMPTIGLPYKKPEIIKGTDLVPVVRCENCIHWSDSNQCARPELSGSRWHDPKYFDTYPDDFCSYGERKE